jgi:acyl-CoA reductase-like NAD-dependent aldehyde dehydrogenase
VAEPMSVAKYGVTLPVSAAVQADADALRASIARWHNASPEERAEWARQADQRTARERAAAEHVPLTLETLLTRVDQWGWSREYVEHLVQPYCDCGEGMDGWEYCQHARDLELTP